MYKYVESGFDPNILCINSDISKELIRRPF